MQRFAMQWAQKEWPQVRLKDIRNKARKRNNTYLIGCRNTFKHTEHSMCGSIAFRCFNRVREIAIEDRVLTRLLFLTSHNSSSFFFNACDFSSSTVSISGLGATGVWLLLEDADIFRGGRNIRAVDFLGR